MHFDPKLIEAMRNAKKVMAFTGAGASKESGLPTFRDLDDGVWRKYDPMTFATIEGFLANPVLVWNNYRSRQIQISQCQPNPGHKTLAAMEDYYPDFVVVTQNVDDLHERGGSKDVVHIHGDAFSIRCLDCSRCYSTRTLDLPVEFTEQTLPKCEACGATCRPDIVWFWGVRAGGADRESLRLRQHRRLGTRRRNQWGSQQRIRPRADCGKAWSGRGGDQSEPRCPHRVRYLCRQRTSGTGPACSLASFDKALKGFGAVPPNQSLCTLTGRQHAVSGHPLPPKPSWARPSGHASAKHSYILLVAPDY